MNPEVSNVRTSVKKETMPRKPKDDRRTCYKIHIGTTKYTQKRVTRTQLRTAG